MKLICTFSYIWYKLNTICEELKIKEKITFDDHHQYTENDIANITGTIVTTEKDAVKLALLNKNNIYALKLKTVLDVDNLIKNRN